VWQVSGSAQGLLYVGNDEWRAGDGSPGGLAIEGEDSAKDASSVSCFHQVGRA